MKAATQPPKKATPVKPANPTQDYMSIARKACERIAPLWPLKNFVAVNPFLGLTSMPFHSVCEDFQRLIPNGILMSPEYYLDKLADGTITESHLKQAINELGGTPIDDSWTPERVIQALSLESISKNVTLPTVTEWMDHEHDTVWESTVVESLSRFCAVYYDQGQSAWRSPWINLPLFQAWREHTACDPTMRRHGLKGFRKWLATIPTEVEEAIPALLEKISPTKPGEYLHKQLLSIRGWAGYVQYQVREQTMRGNEDDSLLHLLAIRLCYDAALVDQIDTEAFHQKWQDCLTTTSSNWEARLVCQTAHELTWRNEIAHKILNKAAADSKQSTQLDVETTTQAVFCIDVRSEVLRRSIEMTAPSVETFGFAGFFGMPIQSIPFGKAQGNAQCPALLTPQFSVNETLASTDNKTSRLKLETLHQKKRIQLSWNAFKTSAVTCFSFVETAGLGFASALLRDTFSPKKEQGSTTNSTIPCLDYDPVCETGISLSDRITLAKGALRNLGLTKNFAPLVLLCGHGCQTKNNPYASGLDCGACGGHSGEANAKVAVSILNDPHVRDALKEEEINIPDSTWFIAGLHNTTTDEVSLLNQELAPTSHQSAIKTLEQQLAKATVETRKARASSLGIDPKAPNLDDKVIARAHDWSQVRPEWGLAGNAAFIAAPRKRTSGINLEGRVFLHNYNHHEDTEKSTLELIMCAPMVVANWINLQYYASTTNNEVFGSGNKAIHNVVGTIGVCSGNGGDLLTGLPMQSVHDGKQWMHEPLRLHVYLEAPRKDIDAVIEKHQPVRDLVENSWLLLFTIEDDGKTISQRNPNGEWIKLS